VPNTGPAVPNDEQRSVPGRGYRTADTNEKGRGRRPAPARPSTGPAVRPLVLSIFPGIGLLDRAFEEEGFTVVRGPDLLWGGDVRTFTPPAGVFAGVIGGPPCQAFSALANIVRAKGWKTKPNMIPEYERIVKAAAPAWFVMENVPRAPLPSVEGYAVRSYTVDNRLFGGQQHRERKITFGSLEGIRFPLLEEAFNCKIEAEVHRAVQAADGKRNGWGNRFRVKAGKFSTEQLTWEKACELQGVPPDFLKEAPFTKEGRWRCLGNGVPLHTGRAIARAVKKAVPA